MDQNPQAELESGKPRPGMSSRWRGLWIVAAVVAAVVIMQYTGAGLGGEDQVTWGADHGEAVERARAEGRPLLVSFTADWCGACQQLKSRVFSRDEVASVIEGSFVPLEVDLTNPGAAEESLAVQMGVEALPTLIVLSPSGEVLQRQLGAVSEAEMLQWLAEAEKRGS